MCFHLQSHTLCRTPYFSPETTKPCTELVLYCQTTLTSRPNQALLIRICCKALHGSCLHIYQRDWGIICRCSRLLIFSLLHPLTLNKKWASDVVEIKLWNILLWPVRSAESVFCFKSLLKLISRGWLSFNPSPIIFPLNVHLFEYSVSKTMVFILTDLARSCP